MKRLNLLGLVIGAAILFSGCAKEDFSPPGSDPADQATPSLKAAKKATSFTGVCIPTDIPGDPGILKPLPNGKALLRGFMSVWYDDATDPLVTGQTTWYAKEKDEADGSFTYWGKAELLVDEDLGKWDMSWKGNGGPVLNEAGDVIGLDLVAYVVGQGKEGAVKGLVAKWTYTMHWDFAVPETFVYNITGSYH
ncbi:MAG: hypothetical protein ABFS10_07485 [Bacteroidota bacterium]